MCNELYKVGTVPTKRYRALAILFFVFAVIGLFIGSLGNLAAEAEGGLSKFLNIFAHSDYFAGDPEVLNGTLFSYVYAQFSMFFSETVAFFNFDGLHITQILLRLAEFAQVAFFSFATVMTLILGLAACVTTGAKARGCAMVSGILLAIAYVWLMLSVYYKSTYMYVMAGPEVLDVMYLPSVQFKLLDYPIFFDPTVFMVGTAILAVLALTAIARRKMTGFINVVLGVILVFITFAITYPGTLVGTYTYDLYVHIVSGLGITYEEFAAQLVAYGAVIVLVLIGFNVAFSLLRSSSKRAYPFDAFRFGAMFFAICFLYLAYFSTAPDGDALRFSLINGGKTTLAIAAILLGGSLLAFLLSLVNCFLVMLRRRAAKAKLIAEEQQEDEIDRNTNDYDALAAPAFGNVAAPAFGNVAAPAAEPTYTVNSTPNGATTNIYIDSSKSPNVQAIPIPVPFPVYPPQSSQQSAPTYIVAPASTPAPQPEPQEAACPRTQKDAKVVRAPRCSQPMTPPPPPMAPPPPPPTPMAPPPLLPLLWHRRPLLLLLWHRSL